MGGVIFDRSRVPLPPQPAMQLRRIATAAATCGALVGLAVWLVDRPVASWIDAHLGDRRFHWLTASYGGHPLPIGPFSVTAAPAEALGPIALAALVILALAAAMGMRMGRRGRVVLALSLCVLAAAEFNGFAKAAFGRTWPESWLGDNPSWIRDGAYGFYPFHGGTGYGSFPSGHTTVITAPATILWIVRPELRILWAGLVAVVAAGLIGADYHFVSDIIGGLYLGVAIGLGTALVLLQRTDRLNWSTLLNRAPPMAPPVHGHNPGHGRDA